MHIYIRRKNINIQGVHKCIHIQLYNVCIYIHVCMYGYIHVCIYTHAFMFVYVCKRVCMYMRSHTHTHTLNISFVGLFYTAP